MLTGPEALDFGDVAALLSDELGRPVRYAPCSLMDRRRAPSRRASGSSS